MHLSINTFGLWGEIQAANGRRVANLFLDKYFAADEEYLGGIGHRSAALEDSRLLPLVEDA